MQITTLKSYRAVVRHGEHDLAAPDLNTEVIGLKASDVIAAYRAAAAVTGGQVREVYRQDRGAA